MQCKPQQVYLYISQVVVCRMGMDVITKRSFYQPYLTMPPYILCCLHVLCCLGPSFNLTSIQGLPTSADSRHVTADMGCSPLVQLSSYGQLDPCGCWYPFSRVTTFQEDAVDETMDISQQEAEGTMRALARVEGIFAGPSSGGAISAALRLSAKVQNATIVAIICDRGDRYLSTGEPRCLNSLVIGILLYKYITTPGSQADKPSAPYNHWRKCIK